MSETHAPFWIYGSGKLQLEFAPSALTPRVTVDGRSGLELRSKGWHLVTVDVDRLVKVEGENRKVGLKLLRVVYIPIAWYPESTYSVVPVTFFASSERR